jgi:bla regulator protein blaR1
MNLPLSWNGLFAPAIVNHVWQSTVAAGIAWLVSAALKKNHARVRYAVWFAATVKFLAPFALLTAAGEWLRSLVAVAAIHKPPVAAAMVQFAQPFSPAQMTDAGAAPVAAHSLSWLPFALVAIWIGGALLVAARFVRGWRIASAARRAATPLALAADVPVLCTSAPMEPGIFGIFRPVLLLPEGILEKLSAAQLRAIVAHEMCHVRRRDNLTFAVHQVIQALFWFHPAVWWIGSRLIEERERACDEAVVRTRDSAETYAEGILNVCRFYLESPAACVAGVTGADLKQRIVRIMAGPNARSLTLGRKLLLGALCATAVTVPVMAGLAWAGQQAGQPVADAAPLPQFDVVSVKPHKDEGMMTRMMTRFLPDGYTASGMPLDDLLRMAFSLPRDRILSEPEWTKSSRYDIDAKVAPEDAAKLRALNFHQRFAMLIPVFQDRFGLKFHHETKELEVYTLVIAKGGPKLKEATPEELAATGPPPDPDKPGAGPGPKTGQLNMGASSQGFSVNPGPRKGTMMMRPSPQGFTVQAQASTMTGLAQMLSQQLGSTVLDKTGLAGAYDYEYTFSRDTGSGAMMGPPVGGPPPDGDGQTQEPPAPPIFTALQEQLGLKLVAQKEKVDVIVIDAIAQPSAN